MVDSTNAQAQQQSPRRESDLPIGLAEPARLALSQTGYWRLEQLTELSEAEVKQLHGVGPKALDQLRRALAINGLSFAEGKSRQ
ncbi:MAG TPA: DNA-binding protein [Ktedonobacteraceae bacterium]|nr:DNA-binding protein [Ktedonobacteraceae bacterium]